MQDGTHKEPIDLDALVNTLLKERQAQQIEEKEAAASAAQDIPAAAAAPERPRTDGAAQEPAEKRIAKPDDKPAKPLTEEPTEKLSAQTAKTAGLDEPVVHIQSTAHADTAQRTAAAFISASEAEEAAQADDLQVEKEPQPKAETSAEPAMKPAKKKFGFFHRRREEEPEPDMESWVDWGLKPIGHYHSHAERQENPHIERIVDPPASQTETAAEVTKEETPSSGMLDEFPSVKPMDETLTMTVVLPSGIAIPKDADATRVLSEEPAPAAVPAVQPASAEKPETETPVDEQLPDQLSMEEMTRVEDIDEEHPLEDDDEDIRERLLRTRQEKIRDFTLDGDEEETNEPEEEVPEEAEEEPEIEDFTDYQDAKAVQLELQYRYRTSLLGLVFTGLLELVLLVLTLLTVFIGESPITAVGYLSVQVFTLGLMMIINHTAVIHGLSGLFAFKANGDTAPAVASAITLLATMIHFANMTVALPFWAPLAGLLLTFSAAGHFLQALCVRRNFAFVSYPSEKFAASLIEEENAQREIGRRAVGEGEATVAYFHPTGFLSDYLTNAYEEDQGDDWSRWATPIAIGLSLLITAFLSLMGAVKDFWEWLTPFVGLICLSLPVTHLAVQLPLNQCCRTMLSRGGFLVGWKAVRQFGHPDALAVDIADLFPDESMLLHGIKTFSGAHIDDAILDAASLSVRSGGPLAMIFRRIIQNKEELLHEVDSLVYEQGMGLSGWVDGRRVLVGNRRLLQNHGVDVPSLDYEARYAKDGRRLVYLSTAGELSAMFVVSYLADPDIQEALQDLCRSKVTLLVRSCDPNITAEDLCACFDLDDYYVDILPASAGRLYTQLAQDESENTSATMASNGHILGTAWVLSACRNLQIKGNIALTVQYVCAAVSAFLCLVWGLNGTLTMLQPLSCMAVSALLIWLVPLFKRM